MEPVRVQLWRKYEYLIATIGYLGMVCVGYAMGWTSPVNLMLRDPQATPSPAVITTEEESWIGSLLPVGALFGFLTFARIGRKSLLLLSSISLFVGWILIAAATNVAFINSGCIFWGVAVGMFFTVSPSYCAEIATDDVHGALGSFLMIFISLLLLVYNIGPFISYGAIAYVSYCLSKAYVGRTFSH